MYMIQTIKLKSTMFITGTYYYILYINCHVINKSRRFQMLEEIKGFGAS